MLGCGGEGVEEESSSQYRQYGSTGRRAPIAARAAAKAPPGAGLETTRGCPGLVIVGRFAGGAGLAGGVRATGHLGPVDRDRVGRLPSADGYGGWGFRRGGVDRVTLFDGTLSGVRSELGGEASEAHILRGRCPRRRFLCHSLRHQGKSPRVLRLRALRELPKPDI